MKNRFGLGRSRKQVWENLHFMMSILVIVLAVLALFWFEKYRLVFSLCFFAAALMHFCNGCGKLAVNENHKRSIQAAIFWYLCALLFLALGIVSLIVKI